MHTPLNDMRLNMWCRHRKITPWSVGILAIGMALAGPLLADERPADLPLIQNKLYPMGMKLELAPLYTFSVNDKYTHHTGFSAALAFHFSDFLGLEISGGYFLNGFGELDGVGGWPSSLKSGWTNLTQAVNTYTHSRDAPDEFRNKPLELPDLFFQSAYGCASVVFSPFYSKWSIVSELGGSIYIYGLAGGGAALTSKQQFDSGSATWSTVSGPVVFPVHYGVGTRVFFTRWLALRLEIRDYWWINPEVDEIDGSGADPCPGGYCLKVDGALQQFTDFSRSTLIQGGLTFAF